MKRVEIKLENRHLNFATQLSFTRETTLRFALSFFFYFFVEGFAFLFLYFFFTSREILDLSLSRQSWLIFLQKSLYDSYNLNISKLINMFRTSVSDLMTGTKSESFLCYVIYFYIFLCELRIERNLFLKLILYFHMAHFISGEKLTSLHCSKNEVGRNICVSSGHQKIVFLHCPSLIIYFLSSRKYFLIWKKNLYIS